MKELGIGVIGTGFMGRAHAQAYGEVGRFFELPLTLRLEMVADLAIEPARKLARMQGFARAGDDWRALIADPAIDVVSITTPNGLHREMALLAIEAGKHVHCEKPLAPTLAEANEMVMAAEAAGVRTAVGFNYLKNPMIRLAREILASGELGEIRSFSGMHNEDFLADADLPWSWRLDPASGGGALGDLGSHILAAARYLVGDIAEVCAQSLTLVKARPVAAGGKEQRPVAVDDVTQAMLRFANGAAGMIEASWIASGRKMRHDFEISCAKGALAFTQERFNELRLYKADDKAGQRGFRTILAGPEHAPYGAFCPAAGHQLGFNDLKTIEMHDFLAGIAGLPTESADFGEGAAVQAVIHAIQRSARERCWATVPRRN